jgi:hypothetical protein
VGDFDIDHSKCYRAELDNAIDNRNPTPRPVFCVDDVNAPGADLLFQASAAFAASAIALKDETSSNLKTLRMRCEINAIDLYERARASGGVYNRSVPKAKGYPNDGFEQYAYWAASWLYVLKNNGRFLEVRYLARHRVNKPTAL